jgi:hypothetical protein
MPTFTEEELRALPSDIERMARMYAAGKSPAEVREATGIYIHQHDRALWMFRDEIDEDGLARLRQRRSEEDGIAEFDVLPNIARNCLVRNGVKCGAAVQRMTDAELLDLRNFGKGSLAMVRQHFPHDPNRGRWVLTHEGHERVTAP